MNEIKEYTEKMFDDIKHIDEFGNEYCWPENYKVYYNILNGENLKV